MKKNSLIYLFYELFKEHNAFNRKFYVADNPNRLIH